MENRRSPLPLPTLPEVGKAIANLRRVKTAGPDGLTSEVFKDDGPALVIKLNDILASPGA